MTAISGSMARCSEAEAKGRPRPSLLVFADDWGRHPSSCQHLIRHLLGRREVDWVNTIGTRRPGLDRDTLARGLEKLRQWTRPGRVPGRGPQGPRVFNPKMWPWFGSTLGRRINRRLLLDQLGPLVASLPTPPIAVATIPLVADLVGVLPVDRWVYYCVDDHDRWPGLDGAALRKMEGRMVERADTLLAVSEPLREKLGRMGRAAHLLTHGVDLELWSGGVEADPWPGLDGLERPLVVFWGVIDRRMDLGLLGRLAADLAAGTILLAGPESDPELALGRIPRLARLGPVPFERLPQLALRASVLIMPYADLPATRAMQPLKLKEYLATGRPAVVRDLPSTRPWADGCDLASTPEGFSAAVRARLDGRLPGRQGAARGRLASEGWERKARDFERWISGPGTTSDDDRDA